MIDVRETLTHRVGPLPTYAWAVVVVGGYVGFRALSGHGGGASTVGGASAPLADLGSVAGDAGASGATSTPLHDIGVPGTYTGSPIDAYQTAVYAYVNGLGNDPGTYAQWAQSVITQSGGTLQHTPVPTAPGNPPPVTTGTGGTGGTGGTTTGTGTAPATVTFKTLSSSAVSYLSAHGSPLDAHQLHLLHIGSPIQISLHQAHLLHLFTGR